MPRCAQQTVMIVMTITNSSGLSSCTRPRYGFMYIQHDLPFHLYPRFEMLKVEGRYSDS